LQFHQWTVLVLALVLVLVLVLVSEPVQVWVSW
jgi:hypothetical protein